MDWCRRLWFLATNYIWEFTGLLFWLSLSWPLFWFLPYGGFSTSSYLIGNPILVSKKDCSYNIDCPIAIYGKVTSLLVDPPQPTLSVDLTADVPFSSHLPLDLVPPLIPADVLVLDSPLPSPLFPLPASSTMSTPLPDYFSKDDTTIVLYKPPSLPGPKLARSHPFSSIASLSLVLPRSAQLAEFCAFSTRMTKFT